MTNHPVSPSGDVTDPMGAVPHLAAEVGNMRGEIALLRESLEAALRNYAGPNALYDTRQLADRWRVCGRTVETLVAEGALVPTYIRGARRFTLAAVESFERSASGRRRTARRRKGAKASQLGQGLAPDRPALKGASSTPE